MNIRCAVMGILSTDDGMKGTSPQGGDKIKIIPTPSEWRDVGSAIVLIDFVV